MAEHPDTDGEFEAELAAGLAEVSALIGDADLVDTESRALIIESLAEQFAGIDAQFELLTAQLLAPVEKVLDDAGPAIRQLQQPIRNRVAGETAKCNELSCQFLGLDPALADERHAADCRAPFGVLNGDLGTVDDFEPPREPSLPPPIIRRPVVESVPEVSFVVWKPLDSEAACYVLNVLQERREPTDTFVGAFPTEAAAVEQAAICSPRFIDIDVSSIVAVTPGGPSARGLCNVDAYVDIEKLGLPSRTVGEPTKKDQSLFKGFSEAVFGETFVQAFGNFTADVTDGAAATLTTMQVPTVALARSTVAGFSEGFVCQEPDFLILQAARATNYGLGLIAGPAIAEQSLPLDYLARSICPTAMPSADDATAAFLANSIDEPTMKSWWKLNNQCVLPQARMLDVKRTKMLPFEMMQLFLRGFYGKGTEALTKLETELRSLGFIRQEQLDGLRELAKQIPNVQDLVRFMVRDADDPKIVERFELDTEFEDKFGGQIREWSKNQGVGEDFMKFVWRSHWRLPSPQQMSLMLHRFERLPDGDPLKTTKDDVRTALKQDDFLPFWIDRMIGISFTPLSRIDIRRAFNIGAISFDGMMEANQQNGMSRENALILSNFTKLVRDNGIFNRLPMKLWKQMAIGENEALQRLRKFGFDEDLILTSMEKLSATMNGVWPVKHFAKGIATRADTEQLLREHGILARVYTPWLDLAETELKGLPTQAKLKRGLIDAAQADADLQFFGYGKRTIERLIAEAARDMSDHPATAAFLAGVWTRPQAVAKMNSDGITRKQADKMLDNAAADQRTNFTRRCSEAFVDRFMHGEFTLAELRAKLADNGMDNQIADQWAERAGCEFAAKSKLPAVNTLCGWVERGAISPAQFVIRLRKLGYSEFDANNTLVDCIGRLDTKKAADAARAAKADAATIAKAERRAKATAAAITKRERQLEANRKKARTAEGRRRKQLLRAADKLRTQEGIDLADAADIINAAARRVEKDLALTRDESIAVVVQTVEGRAKEGPLSFAERLESVIAILPESDIDKVLSLA